MEHRRFDALSRVLGASTTRRSAVRAGLAMIVGGVAVGGTGDARAGRATCRALGSSCSRGAQCCTGVCETSRTAPRAERNRCVGARASCVARPETCLYGYTLGYQIEPGAAGVCQARPDAPCTIDDRTGAVSCVTDVNGCSYQTCFRNHNSTLRSCAVEEDCVGSETCVTGWDIGDGYERFPTPSCVYVSGYAWAACDAGRCCSQ